MLTEAATFETLQTPAAQVSAWLIPFWHFSQSGFSPLLDFMQVAAMYQQRSRLAEQSGQVTQYLSE